MRLGFLGFGLIAGSIARAVRSDPANAAWAIVAWSPSGTGPTQALADGIVDVAAPAPEIVVESSDLVILAAPATACLTLVDRLGGRWRPLLRADAVVTDVASSKALVVARADAAGLRFVGGHPMAGRETAGYGAAEADLFVDRPWILVPGAFAAPDDVARVATLAMACSARVVTMDAEAHDRAVAGISHLPLVVAAALVEAVAGTRDAAGVVRTPSADWAVAAGLAAGGWRDTTRVARGDPAMGAAIASTNAPAIAARLRDLQAILASWIEALERPDGPDEAAILERLAAARSILEESR
jgi:prephenate dehydrogenase